ncbi:hypothetical protein [Marinomonas spartinae]|uniref:hypothetical protein n=1 Tax=Marinomonas spartinae TaxID=1792290 RepID=UPI0018F19C5D|nr:hypothetical protein [Marinomonas spartinae]MBJ7555379.1 hypothetical protein [Marinomonas spartinae]
MLLPLPSIDVPLAISVGAPFTINAHPDLTPDRSTLPPTETVTSPKATEIDGKYNQLAILNSKFD